ncbi:MAG: hypothetical protein FWC92_01655 [Defluviitaleaceae bacterium]|nr:hypothetical protein [Defluviitaleaceae bacterium]
MEVVLITRETVVKFFKRFEVFFLPILKFLLGLFIFSRILSIGFAHEIIEPFFDIVSTNMLTLLFAILFTVMPVNLSWLLIIFIITAQISASIELAVAVFLFLFLVFLFYGRMAVKESYIILFVVLAYMFNVPYLAPLIIGLYFPVTAIIPVVIGVFISANIPIVLDSLEPTAIDFGEMDIPGIITELPTVFTDAYTNFAARFGDSSAWVLEAVVFAMVVIVVYFVSRQAIDWSKEIAIGLGVFVTIMGFILMVVFAEESIPIFSMLMWTILCGIIAILVRLFDSVLDYQRAESVQFEDDNNYYHVRVVPKVIMTKPKRVMRRIRPQAEPEAEE